MNNLSTLILIYCLSFLISNVLIVEQKENDEGYAFFICICPVLNTIYVFKEIIIFIIHIRVKFNFSLKRLYEIFKK